MTGDWASFRQPAATSLRKEFEDLIGLDAYNRIEGETVKQTK